MKLQLFMFALLLASTLVHEAGHVLAGWAFGYRVVGLRYIPPGVHLRGPRGANGIAPPIEAVLIAAAGPMASLLSAWAIWASPYRDATLVWLLAGAIDIVGSDGYQIVKALLRLRSRSPLIWESGKAQ